jgi:hypothetical protein
MSFAVEHLAMSTKSEDRTPQDKIDANGLRYRNKTPGSPFAAQGAFASGTMSCFLCGKHRPRNMLKSRRLLGRNEAVCAPNCATVDEQLAKG